MQYMSKLVICKAALTSHIILQDIIYKTPSGNTIEPALMDSPYRRRSVSIKCQLNSSLQSASARDTIAFQELFHMPFLAFPNALLFRTLPQFFTDILCVYWRNQSRL